MSQIYQKQSPLQGPYIVAYIQDTSTRTTFTGVLFFSITEKVMQDIPVASKSNIHVCVQVATKDAEKYSVQIRHYRASDYPRLSLQVGLDNMVPDLTFSSKYILLAPQLPPHFFLSSLYYLDRNSNR